MKRTLCPVCGLDLDWPPLDYDICPCCGTEFGYSDSGRSHAELRQIWIAGGMKWFDTSYHVVNWSPVEQLKRLRETTIREEFKLAARDVLDFAKRVGWVLLTCGLPAFLALILSQAAEKMSHTVGEAAWWVGRVRGAR